MPKYHISPAGEPGVCNARKRCPYGDMEQDHYESPQEARRSYELENETTKLGLGTDIRFTVLEIAARQLPNASRVALENAILSERMSEHTLNIAVTALDEEWKKLSGKLNGGPFHWDVDDIETASSLEKVISVTRPLLRRAIAMKQERLDRLDREFGRSK